MEHEWWASWNFLSKLIREFSPSIFNLHELFGHSVRYNQQLTGLTPKVYLVSYSYQIKRGATVNKKIIIKKKAPTTVQLCKLENIEHKSMK